MAARAFGGGKGPGPSEDVAREFIDSTPAKKRSLFAKKGKKEDKKKSLFEKRKK